MVFCCVALFFLVEAINSDTFFYLLNVNTSESLLDHMQRLRQTPPQVSWHIQCYHYVVPVGPSTYAQRVNTHSATGTLFYTGWSDESVILHESEVTKFKMTKINLDKSWTCDAGYARQKSKFIRENNRDKHYDFSEDFHIGGFQDRQLALVDMSKKPCFAHWSWYILSQLTVIFALPYRMWLSSVTGKVCNTIRKTIITIPVEEPRDEP